MYPPKMNEEEEGERNMIKSRSTSPSDTESSSMAAGSPHSSESEFEQESPFSSSVAVGLGGSRFFDNNQSPLSYSPPATTHEPISPAAPPTMDDVVGVDPYFSQQHQLQLSSLYQVPHDDDDPITFVLCQQHMNGGSLQEVCGGERGGGGHSSPEEIETVGGGGDRHLPYGLSAFSDYHQAHPHHHNSNNHHSHHHHLEEVHLVDPLTNQNNNHHQSSPPFYTQEPMLGAGTTDSPLGTVVDCSTNSNLLLTSSPNTSLRRLPSSSIPIQSPITPHPIMNSSNDFAMPQQIRNARRTSSSSVTSAQVANGGYGGGVMFDAVDVPYHRGHNYQLPWCGVAGNDVSFVESLLPSPTGLFPPFSTSSAHFDPTTTPFAFFPSHHHPASIVNSPTSPPNPALHYFDYSNNPQRLTQNNLQSHSHQYQSNQFVNHPYFQRNLSQTTSGANNTMPQNFTGFQQGQQGQQKSSKKGGRRPKEEQMHLPPEEEEKRKQRRARNKEAAARCRKRRLDHMTTLAEQVSGLQDTQAQLEREIEQLSKEKEELEFVLKTHEPVCRLRGQIRNQVQTTKKLNNTSQHQQHPVGITVTATAKSFLPNLASVKSEDLAAAMDCEDKITDPPLSSASKHMKFTTQTSVASMSNNWTPNMDRPHTLHFRTTGGDLDSPGIPIQTPSKIFAYDPLNIPTGLTPMTSGLTPILNLANAAATLETPTTSVLSSMGGNEGGNTSQKALQSL